MFLVCLVTHKLQFQNKILTKFCYIKETSNKTNKYYFQFVLIMEMHNNNFLEKNKLHFIFYNSEYYLQSSFCQVLYLVLVLHYCQIILSG